MKTMKDDPELKSMMAELETQGPMAMMKWVAMGGCQMKWLARRWFGGSATNIGAAERSQRTMMGFTGAHPW